MKKVGNSQTVIRAFVDGLDMHTPSAQVPGGYRLTASGDTLYSYRTEVAKRLDDGFAVTPAKYGPSTGKALGRLRYALRSAGYVPTDATMSVPTQVPGRWGGFGFPWHPTGIEDYDFVVWKKAA